VNPDTPYDDSEILSQAWLVVADGKVKEEGDMKYAILRAIQDLDTQAGSRQAAYPEQLRNDGDVVDPNTVDLNRPVISDADAVYRTIECPTEQRAFRHYVDNNCHVDAIVVSKDFDYTLDEALEVITRLKKQLRQEILNGN